MKKIRKPRLILWAAKGMFKSARKLADAIKLETDRKVLIVRSDSPRFKARDTDLIINWGNSNKADWNNHPLVLYKRLNVCPSVAIAVNKLKTFQALQDKCNIPEWTTDPILAQQWADEGYEVLLRNKLTGFGGKGIELFTQEMNDHFKLNNKCPLFVKYKKKKKEFRVHVFNGEVIDVTQKKKRKDFDGEINTKIRNYGNGWVYCREDIVEPEDLRTQAVLAVHSLDLDFGAVDCIWNEKENKTYVLEANTAPGLEGTTIEAYKNAILKELN